MTTATRSGTSAPARRVFRAGFFQVRHVYFASGFVQGTCISRRVFPR